MAPKLDTVSAVKKTSKSKPGPAETSVVEPTAPAETAPAQAQTPEPTAPAEPTPPAEAATPAPAAQQPESAAPVPTPTPDAVPVPTPTANAAATPAPTGPDSYDSLFPEPTVTITPPPHWIIWLVLIILSGSAIIVGYFTLSPKLDTYLSVATPSPTSSTTPTSTPTASTSSPSPEASPTPEITPSSSPTPTPAVVSQVSGVTLRILNGTKTTGAVAKAKTILEKGGYTVKSIGNAKNQNYAATIVYYQTGREAEAKAVLSTLDNTYSATIQQSSLANPDMILVVIGAN